jgi:hypothetical protein|tara:strand:- start:78 stop:236 length:159 start_codon:yes stop_codon:yes gene_type:complete
MEYPQIWAILFFVIMILTMSGKVSYEGNLLGVCIIFAGIFAFPIWLIFALFK